MQASSAFTKVISDHLQKIAETDLLFAETLKKPNKNINECITYILNQVQKSGINGFADEEIYNMAIHYYDEDNLDVGKPLHTNVVVNHKIEVTQAEIEKAKQAALNKIIEEEQKKLTEKAPKKKVETVKAQVSLF